VHREPCNLWVNECKLEQEKELISNCFRLSCPIWEDYCAIESHQEQVGSHTMTVIVTVGEAWPTRALMAITYTGQHCYEQ
jgi:hypothetical protein